SLLYHLHTLFLFNKSDVKTVIVPQAVFALAAASSCLPTPASGDPSPIRPSTLPSITPTRTLLMLAWLYLHVLLESIANQRLPSSILEDSLNKPWRPLPAGRITPSQSQRLLRFGVPAGLVLSVVLGNVAPAGVLICLMWVYNDLDGSSAGPLQRNLLNAAGLACFGWGALGALRWTLLIALIVATTIHAQDFPDLEGDRERGRRTMPLVYGQMPSRWALAAGLVTWSVVCLRFWVVPLGICWMPPVLLGGFMAGLTVVNGSRRDQGTDELVWKLWCLWMAVLFLLP
ncbi:UbiA prenyltransferase family-domain-containing protein, partial [Microdochium trichocladiopsis]